MSSSNIQRTGTGCRDEFHCLISIYTVTIIISVRSGSGILNMVRPGSGFGQLIILLVDRYSEDTECLNC